MSCTLRDSIGTSGCETQERGAGTVRYKTCVCLSIGSRFYLWLHASMRRCVDECIDWLAMCVYILYLRIYNGVERMNKVTSHKTSKVGHKDLGRG